MNEEGIKLVEGERKKYFMSCFFSPMIGLVGLFYLILRTQEMADSLKVLSIMFGASLVLLGLYAPIRGYIIASMIVVSIKKSEKYNTYELISGRKLTINNNEIKLEKGTLLLFSRTSNIIKIKTNRYKPLYIIDDFWENKILLSIIAK